ncbi:hypothetical protein [Thauera sp.]|uniref:hypothetical protein n=1 Tax=Thauera sp. TaxID=1905334 RepID=UPI0039E5DD3E
MSKADKIAEALRARLMTITRGNGYATDLGKHVYEGKQQLDPESLPAVVMIEPEDTVGETKGRDGRLPAGVWALNTQPFQFDAVARCDPDNPNRVARLLIADIKRAIFSDDLTLGGLVTRIAYTGRIIDARSFGSDIVAAGVAIEVIFQENLANP